MAEENIDESVQELSGTEKSAILMMLLGEDEAAGKANEQIKTSKLELWKDKMPLRHSVTEAGEEGQEGYGWMMLGMVLACMGLQLVVVMLQNGKAGWGKLLREALIAVSGLKPGECECRTKERGVARLTLLCARIARARRCRRHEGCLERGDARAPRDGREDGAGVHQEH